MVEVFAALSRKGSQEVAEHKSGHSPSSPHGSHFNPWTYKGGGAGVDFMSFFSGT